MHNLINKLYVYYLCLTLGFLMKWGMLTVSTPRGVLCACFFMLILSVTVLNCNENNFHFPSLSFH